MNNRRIFTVEVDQNNPKIKKYHTMYVLEDTGGDSIAQVGSYYSNELPFFDLKDEGKTAYVKDTHKYAYWNGQGWVYMDGSSASSHCLTFTLSRADAKPTSIGFYYDGKNAEDLGRNMQFSLDGGITWEDYSIGVGNENCIFIEIDDKQEGIMFRGRNDTLSLNDVYIIFRIQGDGLVSAKGDITSLLNGIGYDVVLTDFCYHSMFLNCDRLSTAPNLPSTTLANNCYDDMFNGCANIASHDVATLNNSVRVFNDNWSCASLTIHAETPPIDYVDIKGLRNDCIIYVPAASVDAYKKAQYWSERAAYIKAMP